MQKYSFTLSDGTVVTRSEGQPEGFKKSKLIGAEAEELSQLVAANKGNTLATYEEDVKGKPFKFTRVKYVLSDAQKSYSRGDILAASDSSKLDQPKATAYQCNRLNPPALIARAFRSPERDQNALFSKN